MFTCRNTAVVWTRMYRQSILHRERAGVGLGYPDDETRAGARVWVDAFFL